MKWILLAFTALPALLLAFFALYCWLASRGTVFTTVQYMFLTLARWLVRFWWRLTVEGQMDPLAADGAVLICNHRSSVDPFFVQAVSDRPVHWMVAREYFKQRASGWFLRLSMSIPTGRGGVDTASTKSAIRLAKNGGFVGMFPEGRINTTEDFMLPCRPGAILVALRAQKPIVPCYVEGSPYGGTAWSPFLTPTRVKLKVGPAIDLSPYYDRTNDHELMRELAIRCFGAIASLAGRADFEPEIAGRRWKPKQPQPETASQQPNADDGSR